GSPWSTSAPGTGGSGTSPLPVKAAFGQKPGLSASRGAGKSPWRTGSAAVGWRSDKRSPHGQPPRRTRHRVRRPGHGAPPGPNMVYLVSRPITQGPRAGLVSLLGVAAGFLVYLGAATAGLLAVFTLVPAASTALKLAGAAVCFSGLAGAPGPLPAEPPRGLSAMGLATSPLTPRPRSCTS